MRLSGARSLSAMPLPGLDGGFHSAYTIWHNYFAPFGDPDYEPEVVCPGQARRQDRYALSAVREALTTGELDISTVRVAWRRGGMSEVY